MSMTVSSLTSTIANASGVTTITDWSWVPNGQMGVAGFEKLYPNIHIDLTNVGAGSNEYTKLSTAIAAGSGAPCIAQVEFDHLPAYEAKPGLVNIAQYGANQYKSAFPGWVWQLMSNGSAVYALAQDIGAVGFAYRPAIFSKYHLAVPKTWAQFATEAVTLHKDNPSMYMTYYGNDDATLQGLTSQAGGQMFQQSGSSWKVELNNPYSQKVMAFWGQLIKEGAIPVESLGSPAYGKAIASGEFASYLEAAWDPTYLGGFMVGAPVQQQLLMTNLPQWNASGKLYSYDFGGSSYVVTNQCPTADRADAVKFLGWLFTSKEGITLVQGNGTLKPGQPGAGEGEFAAASARATVRRLQRAHCPVRSPTQRLQPVQCVQWPGPARFRLEPLRELRVRRVAHFGDLGDLGVDLLQPGTGHLAVRHGHVRATRRLFCNQLMGRTA